MMGRATEASWQRYSWILMGMVVASLFLGCQRPPSPATPEDAPWLDPAEQVKLLRMGDYRLRILAARNLGNLGARAASSLPELEKHRDDPNPKVREAVRAAIEKIQKAKHECSVRIQYSILGQSCVFDPENSELG